MYMFKSAAGSGYIVGILFIYHFITSENNYLELSYLIFVNKSWLSCHSVLLKPIHI